MYLSKEIYRLVCYSFLALTTLLLSGCRGPDLIDRARDPWAYGCCGIIILVLDIIAIVEVLNSPWDTSRKVLWILLILFFPILGLILYYLFGRE